jgi:naphthalene 1,2-dioxygenase ferredoxin component
MAWIEIATLRDLRDAAGKLGREYQRFRIALYEVDGKVYATSNLCTHGGAMLSEGYLEGYLIECPMHQGLFDIRTGAVAGPPCKRPVRTFPVRLEGDTVAVEIPDPV